MQNARLDELQAGIKTARRSINNLRYADETTLLWLSQLPGLSHHGPLFFVLIQSMHVDWAPTVYLALS